jgi:hypothetical protein
VGTRKNIEPAKQPQPARRALLTGGAVGLAAVAGATLGGIQPASAATQNVTWITPTGDTSGNRDRTAIGNALNSTGVALLGPGTFYVNPAPPPGPAGIVVPYGGVLAGAGPGVTLINAVGAGTFIYSHSPTPAPYPYNVPAAQITGFTLDLSAITGSSVGIDFGDGSDFHLDQIRVTSQNPMPAGTIPVWEVNRIAWTEKALVRVQVYNPPAGTASTGGSAGYVIDQVSGDGSHMYSWHEIHVSVKGPGCGVQVTNGSFVQNARLFKVYGNFFQSSANPTDSNGNPLQWCLNISGNSGSGAGAYSRISTSHVEIGVETDTGSGTATTWQTIKFGSPASNQNRMLDNHGQLTFLNGNGGPWSASNAVGPSSGNLTFGGVITGDSALTGANSAPSGWL